MKSLPLYSDCTWNEFSKTEDSENSFLLPLCIFTLFCKSYFMRTKTLKKRKKN